MGQQHIQQGEANELAGRKQALIAYGYDPSLDALYPDEATMNRLYTMRSHDAATTTTVVNPKPGWK